MQTSVRWTYTSEEDAQGNRPPVNCVKYSPYGDYVVASCGVRVLVYATATGSLVQCLKGHHNTINCVDYSPDGKRIASGGSDNLVIIWSSKGEGIVKYQHKQSIQALAHNPVTNVLASVSNVDWGLWTMEQSKVPKRQLPSKGLCAAWTSDGQTLAIGMINGVVAFLADGITEKSRVVRHSPIWTIAFSPQRENGVDVLAVGSWDQRLSFYNIDGKAAGKERELNFDPCSISYFSDGRYMLVSGSDHKVSLHTRDGGRLVTVTEIDDWVWSAQQRPGQMQITCGTNGGTLSNIDIQVTNVHCLYHDQYIYRDNLTDVVVHQLTLDRTMIIPCEDYVRALATYRDRLAVLFQEMLIVFELYYDEDRTMRYHDIAQIRKHLDCSIMATARHAILMVNDKRITMYDFHGNKRREWSMDSPVTFLMVHGGADEREVVLVGLKSGQCMKLFVDNPFPIQILKIATAVHSMHLNCMRTKLSVVDEANNLTVYDLTKKNAVMFTEPDVNAALFDSNNENIIAYSTTKGTINVKTEQLPPFQQPIRGQLIALEGGQIFLLNGTKVMSMDVPHSHALYRYVSQKDFDAAYRIASMGVTYGDWMMVGLHAMTHLRLDIARKAFTRIHDVRFVELLNALELSHRQSGKEKLSDDSALLGDILAFQGKYQEAARQYIKCNHEEKAIEMYSDLKMWEEARKVCSDERHLKEIIGQQARWAEDSQNYVEAASLYETCGDYGKAIAMLGCAGDMDKLIKVCRALPKSEVDLISTSARYFKEHDAIAYAIEAYEKVGDNRSLIQAYVEQGDWKRAFNIIEKSPQFARDVYVPWANWLADNDKFEEALEAFRAAKWPREAIRMMETLASNNVTCRRFTTAAFYFLHLASEYGQFEDGETPSTAVYASRIKMSNQRVRRADIYYAYAIVYTHTTQPFPCNDLTLFRTSKYLLAMCSEGAIPVNVGKAEILYTLARAANRLDMVRTARTAYEKLQTIILPLSIMEQVDVETLLVRSKEFLDKDELLDRCYRCNQSVPQLTLPGDRCPHCFHPFVRSFVNFEALPLVEFTLANELSDAEAEKIITTSLGVARYRDEDEEEEADAMPGNEWKSNNGANVINFEENNIDYQIDQQLVAMGRSKAAANKGGDPFFAQLQYVTRPGRANGVYQPFVANADMLRMFTREEIFIVKPSYGTLPVPNRYYRLMDKEAAITVCKGCQHFFLTSDYEAETMKGSGCPLCRHKPGVQIARSLKEIMLSIENQSK
eukprot:gene4924-3535_t